MGGFQHKRRPPAEERPASAASLWSHASLHTPAALRARAALRHHRRVLEQLDLWWSTAVRSMEACGRGTGSENALAMCEEEYVKVSKKIYRAMIEPYDDAEATANALREWADDAKPGADGDARSLPAESFKDAIFELADLWTSGIDAIEYALFLSQLFHRIADGQPPDAYLWLPTAAIVHGGHTSPRNLRADEPPPPAASHVEQNASMVDLLRLDDHNNVTEESHAYHSNAGHRLGHSRAGLNSTAWSALPQPWDVMEQNHF